MRSSVLLVDDHRIFREGIKRLIDDTTDLEVAGEAADGPTALATLARGEYDVVLLDISLPGRSGLEVLEQIRARDEHLPVLILSMHSEDQYAVRAIRAGASGYLSKDCRPEELLDALRRVVSGRRFISPRVAEALADSIGRPDADGDPHEALSDRELQVLRRLARGASIKEIAEKLHLSPKTVSTYRARILLKMDLKTNADLTRYAVDHALID